MASALRKLRRERGRDRAFRRPHAARRAPEPGGVTFDGGAHMLLRALRPTRVRRIPRQGRIGNRFGLKSLA